MAKSKQEEEQPTPEQEFIDDLERLIEKEIDWLREINFERHADSLADDLSYVKNKHYRGP
jgi:hypothetical protein